MSDITWRYDAPEDLIKREILERFFTCVASMQRLDRYRMRTGQYPGTEAREFIGHVTGLWRSAAVLVGQEQKKIDKVHSLRGMEARLKFAIEMFYTITKKLKTSGILRITTHPKGPTKRGVRDLGRSAGAGVADDY